MSKRFYFFRGNPALMATIKDVAVEAGVAISTVSAVINGTARVSPKRSQRVWDAIKKLGYSPDGVARSLRLGRTKSIGLIVGDISNPFFTSLIKVVEHRANKAGYLVIVANSDDELEKELELLRLFREQRVAGVLLAPVGDDPSYTADLTNAVDVPLVLIDRQLPDAPFDTVVVDNLRAAQMVTDYLIRLNHRRIAIVIGKQHLWTTDQRVEGYRRSLRAAGLQPDPDLECIADSRIDAAYQAVQKLLAMPTPPTAIFAANNLMMLGAVEAASDMGFRCPEDVSIAGIDDLPWSSAIRPRLTTVSQPIDELGERAVEMLLDRIVAQQPDGEKTPQTITLEPTFVIRDSCVRVDPAPADIEAR